MAEPVVRFLAPVTQAAPAFWARLHELQLERWGLELAPRPIHGKLVLDGSHPTLNLFADAFDADSPAAKSAGAVWGTLLMVPSLDHLKRLDKTALLAAEARALFAACASAATGERLHPPLFRFLLLAYADLKARTTVVWTAFPALVTLVRGEGVAFTTRAAEVFAPRLAPPPHLAGSGRGGSLPAAGVAAGFTSSAAFLTGEAAARVVAAARRAVVARAMSASAAWGAVLLPRCATCAAAESVGAAPVTLDGVTFTVAPLSAWAGQADPSAADSVGAGAVVGAGRDACPACAGLAAAHAPLLLAADSDGGTCNGGGRPGAAASGEVETSAGLTLGWHLRILLTAAGLRLSRDSLRRGSYANTPLPLRALLVPAASLRPSPDVSDREGDGAGGGSDSAGDGVRGGSGGSGDCGAGVPGAAPPRVLSLFLLLVPSAPTATWLAAEGSGPLPRVALDAGAPSAAASMSWPWLLAPYRRPAALAGGGEALPALPGGFPAVGWEAGPKGTPAPRVFALPAAAPPPAGAAETESAPAAAGPAPSAAQPSSSFSALPAAGATPSAASAAAAAAASSAADLNLRLMRWRALPELDIPLLASTRVLLLGAGTLGCYLARALLGWGLRRFTFVDSGRVSFSNPVRQPLFELVDAAEGMRYKAVAAAEALARIHPGVEARGVVCEIPMPGHGMPVQAAAAPVPEPTPAAAGGGERAGEGGAAVVASDAAPDSPLSVLSALVSSHDVVFLLTDSRESRWLPTLLAAAHGKLAFTVALAFDGLLVMRHGVPAGDGDATTAALAAAAPAAAPSPMHLGCYMCTDPSAIPGNSTAGRAMDQQCTVTRAGAAPIAAALAAEALITLLHHPHGAAAPHDPPGELGSSTASPLGAAPHMTRFFLTHLACMTGCVPASPACPACSPAVRAAYASGGADFVAAMVAPDGPARLQELAEAAGNAAAAAAASAAAAAAAAAAPLPVPATAVGGGSEPPAGGEGGGSSGMEGGGAGSGEREGAVEAKGDLDLSEWDTL